MDKYVVKQLFIYFETLKLNIFMSIANVVSNADKMRIVVISHNFVWTNYYVRREQ